VRYYDQDLALAKDLQDKMNMGRAYCNLGLAHLALGNLETALECQKYFLGLYSLMRLTVCSHLLCNSSTAICGGN
jgi:tetratricopeptide (TPR) repeat protein